MRFHRLKRRECITLLGGALAWPVAARAQQMIQKRRIGVLMAYAEGDREGQAFIAAFREELRVVECCHSSPAPQTASAKENSHGR
jgi:xanthine/CO dehydrogenase XdhC/CoxF family maturation factor